jgi:hypothetical protein
MMTGRMVILYFLGHALCSYQLIHIFSSLLLSAHPYLDLSIRNISVPALVAAIRVIHSRQIGQ